MKNILQICLFALCINSIATAQSKVNAVDSCLEAGMDDFIGKPFEVEELLAKIQEQL